MALEDMDLYTEDWWKYNLKINTDRGLIEIDWSDANELARWSNIQAGLYIRGDKSTLQTFYEWFPKWYQMWWDRRYGQGLFALPDDAKIVDVGSGVAVQDLMLAKYLPESTFTLVDKEGFEFKPGVYYDKDYPEYNSWGPVIDGIKTSNINTDRFRLQGPEDSWPDEIDAVTSYLSWCWHYPKETYWQKVLDHLKVGGLFYADVRLLEDRDVMGEISEDMKSEPISTIEFGNIPEHVDNMKSSSGERMVSGYSAVWKRGK
jgi:SAM-dependent methyltransferase